MTTAHDRLFPDDPDPLAVYRRQAAEQEAALETERRKGGESRQLVTLCAEVVRLNARIEEVQAEAKRTVDLALETIGGSVGRMIERVYDRLAEESRNTRRDVLNEMVREMAELRAKVDGAIDGKRTGKEFRFAGEPDDGEVIDLPNMFGRSDLH